MAYSKAYCIFSFPENGHSYTRLLIKRNISEPKAALLPEAFLTGHGSTGECRLLASVPVMAERQPFSMISTCARKMNTVQRRQSVRILWAKKSIPA